MLTAPVERQSRDLKWLRKRIQDIVSKSEEKASASAKDESKLDVSELLGTTNTLTNPTNYEKKLHERARTEL